MMGTAHSLSGLAAWAIGAPAMAAVINAAPTLPLVGQLPAMNLTFGTWLLGSVVCAGAALAPDLDHPSAGSARNALGFATKRLSDVIGTLAGGHRAGTHSLLGVVVFTALAVLASTAFTPWGSLLVVFLLVTFAANALDLDEKLLGRLPVLPARIILGLAASAGAYLMSDGDYNWVLWATLFGLMFHLLGDFITQQGVPWLWPIKRKPMSILPLQSGGWTEHHVITPVLIVVTAFAFYQGISEHKVLDHPVEVVRSSQD